MNALVFSSQIGSKSKNSFVILVVAVVVVAFVAVVAGFSDHGLKNILKIQ